LISLVRRLQTCVGWSRGERCKHGGTNRRQFGAHSLHCNRIIYSARMVSRRTESEARAVARGKDGEVRARKLYILCWREHSRRKLSPKLATPTTLVLTMLVAQCELSRRKIGLLLEVVVQKFAHRPGNPATVGVVRWPAAGDTAGSNLRRLSSLQHRIYNLLGCGSKRRHGKNAPTPFTFTLMV